MSATTAFLCDGPLCNEVIQRQKKQRVPEDWLRITLHNPGGPLTENAKSGAFHDAQCAHAWLDEQLGLGD